MEEMSAQFEEQSQQVDGGSKEQDTAFLNDLLSNYNEQSVAAVVQSVDAALELKNNTEFLRQLILTLSNIRIACRVEMARLSEAVGGLDELLVGLDQFHDDVDAHLSNISSAAETIVEGIEQSMNA